MLWDMSHGIQHPIVHPDSIHHRFQEIFEEEGIALVLSDSGILNQNLSEYEGLILAANTSALSNYSPDEISAIEEFINQGGGLLIMSEDLGDPGVYNLNPVAQVFGTTLVVIGDYTGVRLSFFSFSEHPIFEEVTEIVFASGNGLAAEPPSMVAAWDSTEWRHLTAVTIAEVGEGRFVATGDENVFTDVPPRFDPNRCCIFEADNEKFARNVIRWLFGGGMLNATIDIKPDVLNRKSRGRWITAYIELPGSRDPADVDVSTVSLIFNSDAVSAEVSPTEVGDYDGDGILDRMVKFDRAKVIEMLDEVDVPEEVTLTVAGELTGGTSFFSGEDIIRIIEPGEKKVSRVSPNLSISPNPFLNQVQVRYEVETPSQVQIGIYDVTGRLVRTLFKGHQPAGIKTIVWDGKDSIGRPAIQGIYFYKFQVNDNIKTEKITLLR